MTQQKPKRLCKRDIETIVSAQRDIWQEQFRQEEIRKDNLIRRENAKAALVWARKYLKPRAPKAVKKWVAKYAATPDNDPPGFEPKQLTPGRYWEPTLVEMTNQLRIALTLNPKGDPQQVIKNLESLQDFKQIGDENGDA